MVVTEAEILAWLGRFLWPFLRLSGLFLTAPVMGSRYVPAQVRLGLSVLFALALGAALPHLPAFPANPWHAMIAGALQIAYGALLGLVMLVCVSVITVSGEMMGLSMGLGFARLSAPSTGVPTPVMSELMLWAGVMAYLAVRGPLWLMAAMHHSFQANPAGTLPLGSWHAVALFGQTLFTAGLWMALPVVIGGLAVNAVLGVVSALAPQLNIFSVGFPLLFLAGVWLLIATVGSIGGVFHYVFQQATNLIGHLAGPVHG